MTTILFASFAFALLIGVPIAVCLGFASMAAIMLASKTPLIIGTQTLFKGVDSFPLMAVPFFIIAGEIMMRGGITDRLVNLSKALIGWMKGSLSQVNIVASLFFGSISGSSCWKS